MKKKILVLLLTLVIGITPVFADPTQGSNARGDQDNTQLLTQEEKCKYGRLPSGAYGPVGVRLTVVDSSGNKVSNTVDFVTNTSLLPASGGNFSIINLKPSYGGKNTFYRATEGKTRNQIVSSGNVSYSETSDSVSAYYWGKLATIISHEGFGNNLRRYFLTQFTTSDKDDAQKIFNIMNYSGYTDPNVYQNHFILMEPILVVTHGSPTNNCKSTGDFFYRTYYGTGSEIIAMMISEGNSTYNPHEVAFETQPLLMSYIGGLVWIDGTYGAVTAGLADATSVRNSGSAVVNNLYTSYGIASGHFWMGDWNCPDGDCEEKPPGGPETCTYKGFINAITTDCSRSLYGVAGDTQDWKGCILDQRDAAVNTYDGEFYAPNGDLKFKGTTGSNPYCTVACTETVSYLFPGSFAVYAGNRFRIGSSSEYITGTGNITMTGTTICRTGYLDNSSKTSTINIGKFKGDYESANNNVLSAYNNWQNAEAAYEARNHMSFARAENLSYYTGSETWCAVYFNGATWVENCDSSSASEAAGKCGVHNATAAANGWDAQCTTKQAGWRVEHKYTKCTYYGMYSNNGYAGAMEYYSTMEGHNASCNSDGNFYGNNKGSVISAASSNASNKHNEYNAAVSSRNNVLQNLKNCNNFQRVYNEFEPIVSFVYSDTYYKTAYTLVPTSMSTSSTKTYASADLQNQSGYKEWSTAGYSGESGSFKVGNTDVIGNRDGIMRYDCPGGYGRCSAGTETYPTNLSAEQITNKTYQFKLPENVYRYVAKNGISYNTATDAYNSDYPYKDLGESSLPIRYGTEAGNYDYYLDLYYNDGAANLFGKNQKFLEYNLIQPGASETYKGLTMASNLKYHCTYEVKQRFLEPKNDDLNVIYRTISLSNPFPGENGVGRNPGSNWIGTAEIFGFKMSYTDAYILKNRGVNADEVYGERAMYEFVLTPNNIKTVRKYNRENKNNYNDFKLECTNGMYCKSTFLQEGFGAGYFGFTTENSDGGSCFNATKSDWESCRYTKLGG